MVSVCYSHFLSEDLLLVSSPCLDLVLKKITNLLRLVSPVDILRLSSVISDHMQKQHIAGINEPKSSQQAKKGNFFVIEEKEKKNSINVASQ